MGERGLVVPGAGLVVLALALVVTGSPASSRAQPRGSSPGAHADARQRLLRQLWAQAGEALEQASDALEPPLVPPVPGSVRWQARRISSIALGGPLLALGAGDVDGDGRAELVALTATEVVLIERRGHRTLAVRARAALPAEPVAIRPRDPVGALLVSDDDGDGRAEIRARSSEQARGGWYTWRDGALVELERSAGFPVCAGASAELEPGRNYFAQVRWPEPGVSAAAALAAEPAMPERFFAARCRADLVDPAGRALAVRGVVGVDGTLALHAERRCRRRDAACQAAPTASSTHAGSGVAFEIADIDGDGQPEIAASAATAPGEPDRVTVLSWRGERLERVYDRELSGGVVGVTAGDIDGNGGLELVVAVRIIGSSRVDLWTLASARPAAQGAAP